MMNTLEPACMVHGKALQLGLEMEKTVPTQVKEVDVTELSGRQSYVIGQNLRQSASSRFWETIFSKTPCIVLHTK